MNRRLAVRTAAFALGVVGIVGTGVALRAEQRQVTAELARARDLHGAGFAGAAQCTRCHPEHMASWRRTFHRTMTQDVSPAHPEAVAGDFSGVTYRHGDVTARMHRDGAGRILMTFTRESVPPVPPVEAVVVRAVGSRRYQQFLAQVGAALWRLPMAWHVEEKRWFHMNGAFLAPDPEGDGHEPQTMLRPTFGGDAFDRHVTRWNDNCVFCHNVAPEPRQRSRDGRLQHHRGRAGHRLRGLPPPRRRARGLWQWCWFRPGDVTKTWRRRAPTMRPPLPRTGAAWSTACPVGSGRHRARRPHANRALTSHIAPDGHRHRRINQATPR